MVFKASRKPSRSSYLFQNPSKPALKISSINPSNASSKPRTRIFRANATTSDFSEVAPTTRYPNVVKMLEIAMENNWFESAIRTVWGIIFRVIQGNSSLYFNVEKAKQLDIYTKSVLSWVQ